MRRRLSRNEMSNIAVLSPEQDRLRNEFKERSMSSDTIVAAGPAKEESDTIVEPSIGTPTTMVDDTSIKMPKPLDLPQHDNEKKSNSAIAVVDVVEASNSIALMGSIRDPVKQEQVDDFEPKLKRRHKNDVLVDVHNETRSSSSHERQFQTKKTILLTLGQCLLRYGSPCHRVVSNYFFFHICTFPIWITKIESLF